MAFMCSSYLVKCRIKFSADGIAMVLADLGYEKAWISSKQ